MNAMPPSAHALASKATMIERRPASPEKNPQRKACARRTSAEPAMNTAPTVTSEVSANRPKARSRVACPERAGELIQSR